MFSTRLQSIRLIDRPLGGANGIGASTIRYLVDAGAHVVFGDFDSTAGNKVAAAYQDVGNQPIFIETNVAKYEDNVKLFRTALDKHGRVDHAIACAGIIEKGKWFDEALTVDTVSTPETEAVLDVNLLGTLYFARIGVVYLRNGMQKGENKSLTLLASVC